MIKGQRQFKTSFGHLVTFDNTSTINIEDSSGEFEIMLDPTDLSLLFHSYMGMMRELAEKEDKNERN